MKRLRHLRRVHVRNVQTKDPSCLPSTQMQVFAASEDGCESCMIDGDLVALSQNPTWEIFTSSGICSCTIRIRYADGSTLMERPCDLASVRRVASNMQKLGKLPSNTLLLESDMGEIFVPVNARGSVELSTFQKSSGANMLKTTPTTIASESDFVSLELSTPESVGPEEDLTANSESTVSPDSPHPSSSSSSQFATHSLRQPPQPTPSQPPPQTDSSSPIAVLCPHCTNELSFEPCNCPGSKDDTQIPFFHFLICLDRELSQLSSLEQCEKKSEQMREQLNNTMERHQSFLAKKSRAHQLQLRVASLKNRLKESRTALAEERKSLETKIEHSRPRKDHFTTCSVEKLPSLRSSQLSFLSTTVSGLDRDFSAVLQKLSMRHKRMVEFVSDIYPIKQVGSVGGSASATTVMMELLTGVDSGVDGSNPGRSSSFLSSISAGDASMSYRNVQMSVAGINLPAADQIGSDEDAATALGFVCHCVFLLSKIWGIPLRYTMYPRSSRSYVLDTTLAMPAVFPLFHVKGTDRRDFYFGIVLLSKNIHQLLKVRGKPIKNSRLILLNLKTLLEDGEGFV